jgi:hypothetical protein
MDIPGITGGLGSGILDRGLVVGQKMHPWKMLHGAEERTSRAPSVSSM